VLISVPRAWEEYVANIIAAERAPRQPATDIRPGARCVREIWPSCDQPAGARCPVVDEIHGLSAIVRGKVRIEMEEYQLESHDRRGAGGAIKLNLHPTLVGAPAESGL